MSTEELARHDFGAVDTEELDRDDLREQYDKALQTSGCELHRPGECTVRGQLDAVLAVRDRKLAEALASVEHLRGDVARIRAQRDQARRLLDYAFHLRMFGERAPGGNETWHQWDRDAETFLRSLDAAATKTSAEAEPLIDPDCRDGKCRSCVGGPCQHECHRETQPKGT